MEDDNNSFAILIWKNIFILKWKKKKKNIIVRILSKDIGLGMAQ